MKPSRCESCRNCDYSGNKGDCWAAHRIATLEAIVKKLTASKNTPFVKCQCSKCNVRVNDCLGDFMKGKRNGCGNHRKSCGDPIDCADSTCVLNYYFETQKLLPNKRNTAMTKHRNVRAAAA